MRKVFLAGCAACVVLGACADAPAQDRIAAGEQVYEEHCATCHGAKLRSAVAPVRRDRQHRRRGRLFAQGDRRGDRACPDRNGAGQVPSQIMGVSKVDGIVPMEDRLIAADTARYKFVRKDWFAYNPMRVNVGSIGLADDDAKTGFTSLL